ncbi:hypothetical protein ZHAS_00022234 [Anopheles sinensis]|uniref:Uncharacterized protein n=1 Tax=Anopheles sinensis TaxID=74873 RepID=A0A084WUT9_ANOSI|nr:hypothetical protein ZHAS_00022234 [Anopheles sinensis]
MKLDGASVLEAMNTAHTFRHFASVLHTPQALHIDGPNFPAWKMVRWRMLLRRTMGK